MTDVPPWVVLHVPHDSTHIPADVRNQFSLDDAQLEHELLAMTDHKTLDLFASGVPQAQVIRAPVSRLVLDVERFEDDQFEPMALRGMGAVAAGLILSTGIKLIGALKTNVLGWRWCAALGLSCLVSVAVFRLPLANVLFGLGSLAFGLSFRKMKP